IGIRLWAVGKRFGYVTQAQNFRERFESPALGYMLFAVLLILLIPNLLVGVISAGKVLQPITSGAFPDLFPHERTALAGGIPPWLGGLIVSLVVLSYVFMGGLRGAVWAIFFQTLVFLIVGIVAFYLIASKLGGPAA